MTSDSRPSRWRCACEVCNEPANGASAHFAAAFSEPRHFAATAEGVADALGYCTRHGAVLLRSGYPGANVVQVFHDAATRMLPLLADHRFGDDAFQHAYFGASEGCPACLHEHRAAGRHTARLARRFATAGSIESSSLCITHFQLFARGLKPELRMPALARDMDELETAAQALRQLQVRALPGGIPFEQLPALDKGLGLSAGPCDAAQESDTGPLGEALRACADFESAIGRTDACAVCLEVERTRRRWLAAVPLAAAHHLDDWLFFPTCPQHVGMIAALSDAHLAAAVAAHALHVAAEHAHHQLQVLVRAAETEAERAAARIAHWGRRRRRRKSQPPPAPAPRIVRCAACERLAIAEVQATGRLLRLLGTERQRRAFEAGWGLCMKHHAQAYLLTPKGAVRTLLARDQERRLQEPMAGELAMRRFCGFGPERPV